MRKTSFSSQRQQRAGSLCLIVTFSAFFSLVHTTPARACACCSDPGMRVESAEEFKQYERDEISRIRLSDKTHLYTTPAFPEDIAGFVDPSDEPYELRGVIGPTRWTFELSDGAGKKGTIILILPDRLERFEVDTRDEEEETSAGSGPRLYKEWQFSGRAALSGIVAQGGNEARATLILHGRGNGCTSAEDFTHWTLQLVGPDVKFTLLGKLKKAK